MLKLSVVLCFSRSASEKTVVILRRAPSRSLGLNDCFAPSLLKLSEILP